MFLYAVDNSLMHLMWSIRVHDLGFFSALINVLVNAIEKVTLSLLHSPTRWSQILTRFETRSQICLSHEDMNIFEIVTNLSGRLKWW